MELESPEELRDLPSEPRDGRNRRELVWEDAECDSTQLGDFRVQGIPFYSSLCCWVLPIQAGQGFRHTHTCASLTLMSLTTQTLRGSCASISTHRNITPSTKLTPLPPLPVQVCRSSLNTSTCCRCMGTSHWWSLRYFHGLYIYYPHDLQTLPHPPAQPSQLCLLPLSGCSSLKFPSKLQILIDMDIYRIRLIN